MFKANHKYLQTFGLRRTFNRADEQRVENNPVSKNSCSLRKSEDKVPEKLCIWVEVKEDRRAGRSEDKLAHSSNCHNIEQKEKCLGSLQTDHWALCKEKMMVCICYSQCLNHSFTYTQLWEPIFPIWFAFKSLKWLQYLPFSSECFWYFIWPKFFP